MIKAHLLARDSAGMLLFLFAGGIITPVREAFCASPGQHCPGANYTLQDHIIMERFALRKCGQAEMFLAKWHTLARKLTGGRHRGQRYTLHGERGVTCLAP